MNRPPIRLGIHRARWLAELAEALAVARQLAARLDLSHGESVDIGALEARFVALIAEVEALRRGGGWPLGEAFDPLPINPSRG